MKYDTIYQMGHAMQKRVFGHIWTVKAQISPRIRTVWSGFYCPLLESLATIEDMSGKKMPGRYFADL